MAMMSWMRRTSRYFLAVVVIAFIASLAYFGATQDRGASDTVATVNGEPISAVAYQRAYRSAVERYRQLFKERFSEELLKSVRVQEQVLDQLVTDRLLQQQARAEGVRVSDEELSAEITRIAAFHADGRFSRDQYLRVLARAQLTPAAFEQDLRGELLRQKLQTVVSDGAKVSDAEVRQQWEIRRARVSAAYLLVSPEPYGASVEVSDADLDTYYKAHPPQFTRPEHRRVLAAILPAASVPAPAVTDAEVEAAYQARLQEFQQPARVRVAHILARVPRVGGSAAEEGARAKAEAALQRIRGGADFAAVAREVSEDTATASRGGEVGLVSPGELVPQFEQAAFGLKKGEVTGPVRTPFGYHVIKALETMPGSKKELRDVAPMIRANLVAEGQLRLLGEQAQEVQQALLAAPDFATEARQRGLSVREIGPLARTDAVEGIGRLQAATDAIFGLAPDGVSGAVKVPEGYAIFRLLEVQASQLLPLAEVRGEVVQAVRRQKAQEAARAKAGQVADAWRGGEDPRTLAKREGLVFGETGAFSRAEPMADKELAPVLGPVALTLAQGAIGGPTGGPKGFYLLKVLVRERPDPAEFEKARAGLEREMLAQKRTQVWQRWLGMLRGGATIDINRTLLPQT